MSFFSKKPTVNQDTLANTGMVIKTMQDDLDTAEGIVYHRDSLQTQTTPSNSIQEVPQKKLPDPSPSNTSATPAPFNQNPFISQVQAISEQRPVAPQVTLARPMEVSAPIIQIDNTVSEHSSKLVISIIILIILAASGGVYYFIQTRGMISDKEPVKNTTVVTPEKIVSFLTESPNYLPIATSNATPQSIQADLAKAAQQVATLNNAKPVEFFITDKNNMPISFASFAKISGINLSQATLDAIGEKFSLFIYANNQSPRIGLSIEIKDSVSLKEALTQEESSLTQNFSPLFLGDIETQTTGGFSDGIYQNISLRYKNIHPETGLSVDYAIINNHLVVGTSMNTHHILLDMIK
jgi:hypothetical protein